MSLHKLTAGSGYDYLTRQVAAQDATEKGHTSLASYYTEKGETPGVWTGSGMAGIDGLAAGDVVTAEQMFNLFGLGLHPLATQRQDTLTGPNLTGDALAKAARLGTPYKVYRPDVSPFRLEVSHRLTAFNTTQGLPASAPVPLTVRARIRSEVGREFFRAEFGRDPQDARELAGLVARLSRPQTTAVAGFDLTFSPVKSVSSLWALADPHTAAVIERAHHAAVTDALALIEREALFTRVGTDGVRQVGVRGLVAAAFTHRDSRAGDPDLHTHVAVANKVQTLDGRWLAIDGRVLYKAKVTASETYNTALERHLADALGVTFVERHTAAGRRPVREIAGVEATLNQRWSARRTSIEARHAELAGDFQATHGRPPTAVESLALAQQANLETRQAKHEPRTLAEQRAAWRAEAEHILGGPDGVHRMLDQALHPAHSPAVVADDAWCRATAARIVGTVEGSRSVWQSWHVRAEAQRQVRGTHTPPDRVEGVVDRLVALALAEHSTPITPPTDGIVEPDVLRRRDGSSMYTVSGATLYTSGRILAAEQRLLDAGARADGMAADDASVEVALLESAANGVSLNAGQAGLVRAMATSGRRLQLAIAPAGSGKTTAMHALATAWANAGGTVVGLAPSAAAAAALGEQLGTHTDTLAKLTWSIDHHDQPDWVAQIGPQTLVVIDEAGMADTLSLDAAVTHIINRGGSVRLVGDDQQLAAIGAGGVLRDLAHTHGALRLHEVVRFADPAEAAASLALRDGRPEALGFYLDHRRVHVGDLTSLTDQVFTAWTADRADGRDAIMLAPTREVVAELNQRARTHRLAGTRPDADVALAEGNRASVGDTIITRLNDRRLRVSATDWVKNGDRWTITHLNAGGGVRVQHTSSRLTVTLPADYVRTAVELGYACTIHTAQGVSVDTMHGLAGDTLTRQQLYTMLTRGRHANHAYLPVVTDGDPHSTVHPDTIAPPSPTDLLERILARDEHPTSASTLTRQLADPALRLRQATGAYADAVAFAAEHTTPDSARTQLERAAEQVLPGLTSADAWPTLRAHLLLHAADGHHPITALTGIATGELATAHDPAAVLDHRLSTLTGRGTGPLPWLPDIPTRLADHPTWGPYLASRRQLVSDLADTVRTSTLAGSGTPAWASDGVPPTRETIADVEVWRAATGVEAGDRRPTGPRQLAQAAARWQQDLDRRLAAERHSPLAEWEPLLLQVAPTLVGDEFNPTLAHRLAQLAAAGVDPPALLRHAAAQGPLPDDHPAAALWWRISRHLTPTTGAVDDHEHQHVRAPWAALLPALLGADHGHQLQNSPWWPALVTAVDHALANGWRLDNLLTGQTTPATGADIDPCQALCWRISLVTHPIDDPDILPPDPAADLPPADLHDGYQPTDAVVSGTEQQPVGAGAVEPWASEPIDDPIVDLTVEAIIREGLPLPEPDTARQFARADDWANSPVTRERLVHVNELAARFYQAAYPASWARPYLAGRFGVDLTGDPHWRPGYAPDSWTALVAHLRRHGVTDTELVTSGLGAITRDGRLIDRFRNRAMLPITHDGEILGFVGRRHPHLTDTDKAGPKYLNTPDTPLFHKGDQLYTHPGLLAAGGVPVVVEGPLDAIAVTLAGQGRYAGAAPLGTSLTDAQAAQLRELGRTPIIATDADPAGQAAAERDYWILTPHHLDPRHAHLPDGTDPADLLARGQACALLGALERAGTLAETLIERTLTHEQDARTAIHALRIVAAQPPDQWDTGLRQIANRLQLPEDALAPALRDVIRAWNADPTAVAQTTLRQATKHTDPVSGLGHDRMDRATGATWQEPPASTPRRGPTRRPEAPSAPTPSQTIDY